MASLQDLSDVPTITRERAPSSEGSGARETTGAPSRAVEPPGGDLVAMLLSELRQTVLAETPTAESVIVDADIDLDALLAHLPPAEPLDGLDFDTAS